MQVEIHPGAVAELEGLPVHERAAMARAIEKLEVFGAELPFPHQSHVKGADRLRELRPRSGRSPWRAFYRRVGSGMVVATVGPEALADPRGFRSAIKRAERRLREME